MNRTNFCIAVFEGTVEEVSDYIRKKYDGCKWNCPTGTEDVKGIIDVLRTGAFGNEDLLIEIDGIGNIRCAGDLNTFASIIEED